MKSNETTAIESYVAEVSRLAKAGVAPDVRMRLAGHTSAENHAIYTHDDVSARAAINTLPDIATDCTDRK